MSMNRVFAPLEEGHPLTDGKTLCPLCDLPFVAGQRVTLAAVREVLDGVETVPAIALHANCSLEGLRTKKGVITHIKDGDGSPYPVITDKGQFTLEECELE